MENPAEIKQDEVPEDVSEVSEKSQRVDEVTFEPEAVVEREMDYEEAEAIETAFVEVVEAVSTEKASVLPISESIDGVFAKANASAEGAEQDLSDMADRVQETNQMRADVGESIYYRRQKGTLPMLDELAHDVTGWADGENRTITYTTQEEQPNGNYKRVEETVTLTKEEAEDLLAKLEEDSDHDNSVRGSEGEGGEAEFTGSS